MDQNTPNTSTDAGWGWWAGSSEEWYERGPFGTRDEAIAEAVAEHLGGTGQAGKPVHDFHVIEARQDPLRLSGSVNVNTMIENLHTSLADDYGGDDGESPAEDAWTPEQEADLDTVIRNAVDAWQDRHGIVVTPRTFTGSRNGERITGPALTHAEVASTLRRRAAEADTAAGEHGERGEELAAGLLRADAKRLRADAARVEAAAPVVDLSFSGAPMPPDEIEGCVACGAPFKAGDMVLSEESGGEMHVGCCGPERDSYVGLDGEPLKDGEPIPTGHPWEPAPSSPAVAAE